ncbi:uncharacterized protein LOC104907165 [Beta vulgaris subsp. vulgaris]|uniref:uncharacterized protein LOC104907165 n=1 Tax=Beta vulgaris subsp. vulgaris TaxID=3555 RepID=UPI00053F5F4F|nr:uncharacterized protein LOC104907165 [Beta vulgaris subsp. vulgaris]
MVGDTDFDHLSNDVVVDNSSSSNSHHKPLHPVYIVSNIQHKVRVLDGTKVTYSSWVKLFKLHLRGYKVLHHVDGTPPPVSTDAAFSTWQEIDSHVLQWIYQSISDDLCLPSLDDYCHRLKELADQLSDVDCPVTPNRLVLQLVRGLPPEFDIVASFINQQVPSFETARSMLQLEQQRKSMREVIAPASAALVAPPSPPSDNP